MNLSEASRVIRPLARLSDGREVEMQVKVSRQKSDGADVFNISVCLPHGMSGQVEAVRIFEMDLGASQLGVYQEQYYMPSGPRGFRWLRAGQNVPSIKWWGARYGDEWNLLCHPMTVIKWPQSQKLLLAGFTTSSRFESFFLLNTKGESICLSAWCDVYHRKLGDGDWLDLEQYMLLQGVDYSQCADQYARYVAKKAGACVPKATVVGWSDWQYYREEKCEKDIDRSLDVLARLRREGYPLKHIIVDGGWCKYASEWLQPCDKFPSGMKKISQKLRRKGFELGLWLAPFITNVNTEVAKKHPDWMLLKDNADEPLYREASNVGPCYTIDFSVDAALDWLAKIVRTMVRDWKIGYLKLDGPSLAHYYGGAFRDPQATPQSVIRRALEVIRSECGDGVIVEGEGIFGPSVGMVDTQRVSQDNHPYWYHATTGGPCLKNNVNNELLASYIQNVYWHNHRENVILRDFPSPHYHARAANPELREPTLTENEVRCYLSGASMSGGAMLLTEPMDQFQRSRQRMELIGSFLPHYEGARCRPIDVFRRDGRQPAVYAIDVNRDWETWQVAGLFNLEDQYEDVNVPLDKIVGKHAVHVFDYWNEEYLGVAKGKLTVRDVPAHGCKMLALRRKLDIPQLVGTNMHVFQGAVDIDTVTFERNVLRISTSHPMQRERKLFVVAPPCYELATVVTNAKDYLVDARKRPLVCIQFNGRRHTEFELRWKRIRR